MQSTIYTNLSEWIVLITSITALVFSIVYRSKKSIRPIQFYIIISVVNSVFLKSFDFLPSLANHIEIIRIVVNTYSLLEISSIFYFYFIQFKLKKYRDTLIVLYSLYIGCCMIFWLIKGMTVSFIPANFGIENLLITIASLYYIFTFLKSGELIDFKSSPGFFASCGILFYFSITTPYFVIYSILSSASISYTDEFSNVNYLSYSLLFISFIKAYLCPKPKFKYLPS